MFAVDRGVFDHPKFLHDEPLSRLEAWLWLLSRAAWRPIRLRISGRVIELRRGQLAASTRYMADRWRWKEPRVRRFLHLLKTDLNNDAEIDTQTDAGITVITIRKYDQYQRVSLPANALGDSGIDAGTTHDRRKEEDIKDMEGSEAKASDVGSPVYADAKHQLWAEGVPILVSLGENDGRSRQMVGMWLKQTSDDARRVLSAIQRARDHRVHGPIAWITRALKGGDDNGKRNHNGRTDRASGHATAREASFIASLGKGAFGQLEKSGAAGPIRSLSDDAGAACASDTHTSPASRH
ncbi:hypothetical protein NLM27_32055 [Bradyrhizobium sp. CCGB12]|uniref:hypothetical protein n=1 Tax=Bradyrhizobium sp. CCGB12 TaxID=2949632 RepID=UPI0020B2B7E4|nr:hypothetical protein [Bradyrhizobium sp. CCGB12]MCP3393392.1 hypothetical protein [Bradyrhizobium sp. CCGB12]